MPATITSPVGSVPPSTRSRRSGRCSRCFGPLDPVYDWDAPRAHGDARADRGRPAVDLALRRPAPRRGAGGAAPRARASRRSSPRRGSPRSSASASSGSSSTRRTRRTRSRIGSSRSRRARRRSSASTTLACSSTGNLAGAVAARAAAEGLEAAVFVPADLEPEKLAAAAAYGPTIYAVDGNYDHCSRLSVELSFELPVGLRQRQPALVLRRGLEDARLRDRRAARLARAGRRRDPDRLGRALPQGRPGVRRAPRARPDRRRRAEPRRRPGRGLPARRDRLPRADGGHAGATGHDRALARDRQPGGRRLRRRDRARDRRRDPRRRRGRGRREHGAPRADDGRLRRDGDRRHARRAARRRRGGRGAAARPRRPARHGRRAEDARARRVHVRAGAHRRRTPTRSWTSAGRASRRA